MELPKLPDDAPWWGVLLLPMALAMPKAWRWLVGYFERRTARLAELERKRMEMAAEARARREADNTARQRRQSREYDKERPFLIQQLERAEARMSVLLEERDRAMANETWLREENANQAVKIIDRDERIERTEARMDRVEAQLRECHDQRDLDAAWIREFAEWVMREFTPKNLTSISQPPRRRSITPQEVPVVPRASAIKLELDDDFFDPK